MSKNFKKLIDKLERKWDAELVPIYETLKQRLLNNRALTKMDVKGALDELATHYRNFYVHASNKFKSYPLDETDRVEAVKFLKSIQEDFNADTKEFAGIYNKKVAQLRTQFFQKQAEARLPMPTFEEQYEAWEIFPSDPETHPQYYTCNF